MYKKTSRAMKRIHVVDRIHPSKGFLYGQDLDGDPLPDIALMSDDQLENERKQLKTEHTRWLAEGAAAKASEDETRTKKIGWVTQTVQARLAAVNAEQKRRRIEQHEKRGASKTKAFLALVKTRLGEEEYLRLWEQADEATDVEAIRG